MFYCQALDSEILKIEVIDSAGKLIRDVSPVAPVDGIDFSSCKSGLYLIRLHLREGIKTIKLIKEK
jgi:hypothetical protein